MYVYILIVFYVFSMYQDGKSLHVSVTMPSIEVGTVGGGTHLPAQAGKYTEKTIQSDICIVPCICPFGQSTPDLV